VEVGKDSVKVPDRIAEGVGGEATKGNSGDRGENEVKRGGGEKESMMELAGFRTLGKKDKIGVSRESEGVEG